MKTRKYKVDEWVLYNMLQTPSKTSDFDYSKKALILNICSEQDYYDYEIYIEADQKFKKVREEYLFPLTES